MMMTVMFNVRCR